MTTGFYPRNAELWLTLARLQLQREKPAEARDCLLEGRRRLKRRRDRAGALRLLEQAFEIDDGDAEVALDLAELLRRSGERARALLILEPFEAALRGGALRRLRRLQWRIRRTPSSLLAWLRA